MSGASNGQSSTDGMERASNGAKSAGKGAARAARGKFAGNSKQKALWKLAIKIKKVLPSLAGAKIFIVVWLIIAVIAAFFSLGSGSAQADADRKRFIAQRQITANVAYASEAPMPLLTPIGNSQLNAIQRASTCNVNLPWILIAAIAQVQSQYGQSLDPAYGPVDPASVVEYGAYIGDLNPPYESAPMDGRGVLAEVPAANVTLDDGSVVPDRLVGPLQIRLSYFQKYGVRSPEAGLGKRNPQNIYDQIATISNQFCQVTKANTGDPYSPNLQEQADQLDLRVGLQRFFSEARIYAPPCVPADGETTCPTSTALPVTLTSYYSSVINKASQYGLDIRAFGLQELSYSGSMGMPVELFAAYTAVASDPGILAVCPQVATVRWSLLASIGYHETRWARSIGVGPDVQLTFDPASGNMLGDPIYSTAGNPGYPRRNLTPEQQTRLLHTDADFARWNVTARPDTQHAVGLMQFMPPTFDSIGYRSPRATPAGAPPSIANVYDQIWTAALLLCRNGAGDPARGEAAALASYTGFPVGDARNQQRIDFANLLEQQALEGEGGTMPSGGRDTAAGSFGRGLPDTCNGRLHNTPGCQSSVGLVDTNGCTLRADAATSFAMLRDAAAREGFIITSRAADCYRTYDQQLYASRNNPNAARVAGTSNHGWGYAIDMNVRGSNGQPQGVDFTSPFYKWLVANGGRFGWYLPPWAQQGGSKPEAWHWQYGGTAGAPGPAGSTGPR